VGGLTKRQKNDKNTEIDRAAMALLLASAATTAFFLPPTVRCESRTRCAAPTCCICINCKFVDRCKTYHWVETQHEQIHVAVDPDFEPADPQIQVFIRQDPLDPNLDPEEAAKAITRTPMGALPPPLDDMYDGPTVTTTEFDVFACDAFSEDTGKWIRLMPDAGFVPT